jgi:hypothetical protein
MSQPVDHDTEDGSVTVREIRDDEKRANVTGNVTLERRGSPAEPDNGGARVCLGEVCVTTEADGSFSLERVQPGTIEVSHPSYLRTENELEPFDETEVTLPPVTLLGGDVDQDEEIYYEDGFRMNQSWNQEPGDPRWLLQRDVTNDGAIDVFDLVAVQYNYASVAPSEWTDGAAIAGYGRNAEAGAWARKPSAALRSGWGLEGFLGTKLPWLSLGDTSIHQDEPRAVVRLDPADSVSPGLGLAVPIDMAIANATDVFGYALYLEFDPAMVQVVDADPRPTAPGVQLRLGEFIDPTGMSVVHNNVDNERGVIELAVSATYPSSGSSGDGVLASADFRTIAPGTSRLHFEEVVLYKDAFPELEPIPVTWEGGTLTVAGSQYLIYAPITKMND